MHNVCMCVISGSRRLNNIWAFCQKPGIGAGDEVSLFSNATMYAAHNFHKN